jgi:hypothetical protein
LLHDDSSVPAEKILYWYLLYDLDKPVDGKLSLLPIPSAGADWVRPHESAGPMLIFNIGNLRIDKGDRLAGLIGVSCPNCKKVRWLYADINYGTDGWYAPLTDSEIKGFNNRVNKVPYDIQKSRYRPILNKF